MTVKDEALPDDIWSRLADAFAKHVAEHLAPLVANLLDSHSPSTSPWLTTAQAIEYSQLPEGTFRKLVACGKIPSHGGRSKIYFRPEVDHALLGLSGLADDLRRLRRVR